MLGLELKFVSKINTKKCFCKNSVLMPFLIYQKVETAITKQEYQFQIGFSCTRVFLERFIFINIGITTHLHRVCLNDIDVES